jgi:hypothetical protein
MLDAGCLHVLLFGPCSSVTSVDFQRALRLYNRRYANKYSQKPTVQRCSSSPSELMMTLIMRPVIWSPEKIVSTIFSKFSCSDTVAYVPLSILAWMQSEWPVAWGLRFHGSEYYVVSWVITPYNCVVVIFSRTLAVFIRNVSNNLPLLGVVTRAIAKWPQNYLRQNPYSQKICIGNYSFLGTTLLRLPKQCRICLLITPWPESASELYRPSDRRL